jgi:hypothetical protein
MLLNRQAGVRTPNTTIEITIVEVREIDGMVSRIPMTTPMMGMMKVVGRIELSDSKF